MVYRMKNNTIVLSKITGIFTSNTNKPAYDKIEYSLNNENDRDRYESKGLFSSKDQLLKTL